MVIEAFTTARAYGVEDEVLASLKETFPGIDWEKRHRDICPQRELADRGRPHPRRDQEELSWLQ